MTVAEMLARMTSQEISEWIAFYKVEPFGEERQDWRFALMTANLMAPHLKKGARPKLSDFKLNLDPPRPMSAEEMKTVLRNL